MNTLENARRKTKAAKKLGRKKRLKGFVRGNRSPRQVRDRGTENVWTLDSLEFESSNARFARVSKEAKKLGKKVSVERNRYGRIAICCVSEEDDA